MDLTLRAVPQKDERFADPRLVEKIVQRIRAGARG